MKNALIFLLLFTSHNLYSQISVGRGGVYGMLGQKPDCIEKFERFGDNFKLDKQYLLEEFESRAYAFFTNGKWYMVSYEPTRPEHQNRIHYNRGERKERSLHLWRFDGDKWRIATVEPIQVDYATIDRHHSYFPWRYAAGDSKNKEKDGLFSAKLNGYVNVISNGYVEIMLINIYVKNNNDYTTFYNRLVILEPVGNEMYRIFNPFRDE